MFTEKPVSAFTNATMTASGFITLCMPSSDSDFDDSIENNLVKFSVSLTVQNPHSIIPEFT